MTRRLSPAAEVAKLLKKKAKEMGLVATAKSHNYTGGDSVNVYITEGTDANLAKLKEYSNQYQYGHFDGMIDLYEYSNTRDDIPQTKYLFIEDKRTDTIIQENLDQTKVRFYEHEFKLNDYNLTSWQWLNKFKEQLGEDWQKYLAKFLQDFSDPGINLLAKQYLGWDFQMIKKEAA